MNIKSAEAHDLAKQLAALEHTSVTQAVTLSLREALERRTENRAASERLEHANEILSEMRQSLRDNPGPSLQELMDDLYDDMGLPK